MAWRPYDQLIEGELDNTLPGKVTGWMRFKGLRGKVAFDLKGNFHRDIRGTKIQLRGRGIAERGFMTGFNLEQVGEVGDITSGGPPIDYVNYPYIEWFSKANGRVVLELSKSQVTIVGKPIPACESDPISREDQKANMTGFLADIVQGLSDSDSTRKV